jgi:hypothetical protein
VQARDWLCADDHSQLDTALQRFVANRAYDTGQLCADLDTALVGAAARYASGIGLPNVVMVTSSGCGPPRTPVSSESVVDNCSGLSSMSNTSTARNPVSAGPSGVS